MNAKYKGFDRQTGHRDTNIELFRIITMIMIVAHHYVVHSGLLEVMFKEPLSSHSIFLYIFGAWGKIGINCFVFITGYFMCKSNITAKKFVKLLCEIMFYRIVIYFIFAIFGYERLTIGTFLKILIPVRMISMDFSSCYLVFFLFIPFINILLNNLNQRKHIMLIVLSLFTYTFLGSVPGFSITMNYVSWFIVLYFISSYVRLYPNIVFDKSLAWGLLSIGSILISIVSIFIGIKLFGKMGVLGAYYFIMDSNKLLAVITAFCLFMFFRNIKLPYNKFINTVASSTFGVLLIHDNSDAMRKWLWKDTLNTAGMYDSPYLYVHAIGSVLAIFIICVVIDQIRIRLIEKPFMKLWDKYFPLIKNKYSLIENKVSLKLGISSHN